MDDKVRVFEIKRKVEGWSGEMVKVRAVPCEVYSRIVGYFRPINGWNDGKLYEFFERKTCDLNKKVGCGCGDYTINL